MKNKRVSTRSTPLVRPSAIVSAMGVLGLCGVVSMAQAQSLKAPRAQVSNNLYAGLELGVVGVNDRSSDTASKYALLAGGSATVEQNRSKAAARLFGGYRFNEQAAFELGYVQSDDYTYTVRGTNSAGTAYSGAEKFKFSGFDYSLMLRPTLASGLNNLYVKLGLHNMTRKLDPSVPGVLTRGDSESGTGQLYGIGYDMLNVTQGVDLRLAFTHYDRVGGESGSRASLYSLGVVKRY
jgi:hypothetical protein